MTRAASADLLTVLIGLLGWTIVSMLPAHASGRFFATALQCDSAKALAPGQCRTAFANARAEFAAKAPSYRSRRACFKAFGPCMPWPPGTQRFSEFRPQWIGITLGADGTAIPATPPGRLHLDFAPQSAAGLSPAAQTPMPTATLSKGGDVEIMTPADEAGDVPSSPPRAGGGFTVIDGVLTYPAPARFQPGARKQP